MTSSCVRKDTGSPESNRRRKRLEGRTADDHARRFFRFEQSAPFNGPELTLGASSSRWQHGFVELQ